jgi:hypothetical protein
MPALTGIPMPVTMPDSIALVTFFEQAMTTLTAARDGELAALRSVSDRALAQLADVKAAHDRAEERQRADSLRDRLDALTTKLRQAQEGASELRQAEVARRAGGCWRGSETRGGAREAR